MANRAKQRKREIIGYMDQHGNEVSYSGRCISLKLMRVCTTQGLGSRSDFCDSIREIGLQAGFQIEEHMGKITRLARA